MNKITCICLGVRDMERSVRFYRDRLGFRTDCVEDSPRVCFFDTPGTKFELYPLDLLAEDICSDGPPVVAEGFGGITLTYNVATRQEVDEVIELVRASGGTVVKEPQEVFWGGYHAYFADPDGYYWEVAWLGGRLGPGLRVRRGRHAGVLICRLPCQVAKRSQPEGSSGWDRFLWLAPPRAARGRVRLDARLQV